MSHKICSKCHVSKHVSEYHVDRSQADFVSRRCKTCDSIYAREYRQRPEAKARQIWRDIQRRCGNFDKNHPSYTNIHCHMTFEEFSNWFVPSYKAFRADNPLTSVSLDRRNNSLGYSLDNVQLLATSLHKIKSAQERLLVAIQKASNG